MPTLSPPTTTKEDVDGEFFTPLNIGLVVGAGGVMLAAMIIVVHMYYLNEMRKKVENLPTHSLTP
jgi:hypothetical protein